MAARSAQGGGRGSALVEELAAQREPLLQACWAHRLWRGTPRTRDGTAVAVDFPGLLNRGPGPDFTGARLRLGGEAVQGDVEVHLDEADWWRHGHEADPRYSGVVLHLVLREAPPERRAGAREVGAPVLVAPAFLPADVQEVLADPEAMLRRYERLPGRCGLRAAMVGPEAVGRLVAHAAEERAREKAARLQPALAHEDEAQVLFALLFRYLGYRPNADVFAALAQRYPLAGLAPLLEQGYAEARVAVLARWFGAAGLLQAETPGGGDPQAREEYQRCRAAWRALGEAPLEAPLARGGGRPWNAPERRMVALFHHLYTCGQGGWLKAWLGLLSRLDAVRDLPDFRAAALAELEAAFATPEWEPWRRLVGFEAPPLRQAARLVGEDRLVVLMVNAVIPFFLARARRDGDAELEKLLYRLFLVLPGEAPNRDTRFMTRRLLAFTPLSRSLRTQQGLLHIRRELCHTFADGCEGCELPGLLAAPARSGDGPAR